MPDKTNDDASGKLAIVFRALAWVGLICAQLLGVYLVAVDRLLLAAIVLLSMGILGMVLLGAAQISQPKKYRDITAARMRHAAFLVLAGGCLLITAGAILTWVWPGTLANALLVWLGPPVVIASVGLLWIFRSKDDQVEATR